jgi:hypothetical protein
MHLTLAGAGYGVKAKAALPHAKNCPPEGGRYARISVLTFAGRALKMKPRFA